MIKSLINKWSQGYQRDVLFREYESQKFRRHNERPIEFAFVFRSIGRCAPKTILDVGTGTTALPALMATCGPVVMALDNIEDYWDQGMFNRHWHIARDDIQNTRIQRKFDMVTCVSTLEHIKNFNDAMRSMMGLLNPGGHLVLCGPYTEGAFVENCYKAPGADREMSELPYMCRSYSRIQLAGWGGTVIEVEYWRGWTGEHWAMGTRIAPPEAATRETGNHACFLIRR